MLPPELRHLDGDPLAEFAGQVWRTLTKVGIPVYLLTDDDPPRPYGVTLYPTRSYVQVAWNLPNEPLSAEDTPEMTRLLGAWTVLTHAVTSVLTLYGFQVRPEDQPLPYPPYLRVYPAA
jgi:hypothetical protein